MDESSTTSRDTSRQDATSRDSYTLTIDEAAVRYEHAGHPRTVRSIQRYCSQGHLDCLRQQTTFGDKYMITLESVARHIAQIEELASATRRGLSRPDTTTVAGNNKDNTDESPTETTHDQSRQDATSRGSSPLEKGEKREVIDDRYVQQLEKRIEEKDDVIVLLKGQLTAKDEQIGELSTRYRETHTLLGAMQRMFAPLLGQGDPYKSAQAREQPSSVDNSNG